MAHKSKFKPKNVAKYRGDPTRVVARSSWELKVFKFMDSHPDVLWWQSEEVIVPYISPIDGKQHRYYPDIVYASKMPDGSTKTTMVEIKPFKQTMAPDPANRNKTKTGRVSRRYLNEVKTWGVNEAKWDAAEKFCKAKGWHFTKMTEKEIF